MKVKGTLKLIDTDNSILQFISEDQSFSVRIKSCPDSIKKWFCSTPPAQAILYGTKAEYDIETNYLMTEDWDNMRSAMFMAGTDWNLSHKFS